jgi:DNA-binding transcriptional MerR regulator
MAEYFTSGQAAKKLRVSVSTLKRWLEDPALELTDMRNENGWRLISGEDIATLKAHKQDIRKNGKRFKKDTTLMPVHALRRTA